MQRRKGRQEGRNNKKIERSDTISIPAAGQTFYNISAETMLGDNVKVAKDGSVTGTLKYVTGYTGFSNKKAEQEGNFFPFYLEKQGDTMTFKKNDTAVKSGIPWEKDNVFRIDDKNTKFTVEVDGEEVITFNFENATLDEKA